MPDHNQNLNHDCDHLLTLIPAYAIGAADPDEAQFVEATLPRCPEALAELAAYRRLAADLRESVPQIEPPADLGARIMAAAQPVTPRLNVPLRRRIHPAWAGLAAAVLLLIVTNLFWLTRVQPTGSALPEDALVLSEELEWTRLASESGADAWAWMMWNPDGQSAVLCAWDFPPLEQDRVYQLWLRNDAGRISGGTFRVNERGFGVLTVKADAPIGQFEVAGITTEPDGGSAGPTTPAVVRGEL